MTLPTYEQISKLNQDQRRRYAESCKSAWKDYEETAISFYTELCNEPSPATVESLKAEVERLTKERNRAVFELTEAGWQDLGGERWKPPLGKRPDFEEMDELRDKIEAMTKERDGLRAQVATLNTVSDALERIRVLLIKAHASVAPHDSLPRLAL